MYVARISSLLLALSLPATLIACGGDQVGLEEASETVERISQDVETARQKVTERETEFTAAQDQLNEARRELAEIEAELNEARSSVENAVSDADLFRTVQTALLEDDAFEDLVVSAHVAQRVVTLDGTVPSEELKQRAEETAAKTLGVATVVNQIRVAAPPSE